MNTQRSFDALDVAAHFDDLHSLDPCTSSISVSMDSFCGDSLESISGILSARIGDLSFPADGSLHKPTEPTSLSKRIQNNNLCENSDPVDFAWLLARCDDDPHLVHEVLKSFCEQGRTHLGSMQGTLQGISRDCILFHTVSFKFMIGYLHSR